MSNLQDNLNEENPKVFVSYAWSQERTDWVENLVSRLRRHKIDVIYDQTDLKPGHDINHFMEKHVNSNDVKFVLVVCDQNYKQKSDSRHGGVGRETILWAPHVYSDVIQEKFVPIIAQRDEDGGYPVPVSMKDRYHIDLSSLNDFEEKYEDLVRHIYGEPRKKKVPLGARPSFLTEDAPAMARSSEAYTRFESSIRQSPSDIPGIGEHFLDELITDLRCLTIEHEEGKFLDDQIVDRIHDSLPFRDMFIQYIENVCIYQREFTIDPLRTFFENLASLGNYGGHFTGRDDPQKEHYDFLLRELIVFTTMILIRRERYQFFAEFLSITYFIPFQGGLRPVRYDEFSGGCRTLEDTRNVRLNLRKLSVTAHLIMEQRLTNTYTKDRFVEADLLLYYISRARWPDEAEWFPITYVYNSYLKSAFLQRLQSRVHVEKVSALFGASNISELIETLSRISTVRGYNGSGGMLNGPVYHVELDKIGTCP